MRQAPLAVAWDVDGTLVDSEPLHLRALLSVCAAHGVDIADHGPVPFVGIGIHEVWRLLDPRFGAAMGQGSERERNFRAAVAEQYEAGATSLKPMPGALDVLQALAGRDVPMCAVSNSEARIVGTNLEAIGARSLMRFVITLDDVVHAKPHPEPYRSAARRLGLPAHDVVAVEDSASGMNSALAAGLRVLVLAGDGRPQPWHGGADAVIDRLESLLLWWHPLAPSRTPAPPDPT